MDNELAVKEESSIIRPAGTPEELAGALTDYKKMQETLDRAMPDSIMVIQGKKFRKKSYWRGVKTAFNLKVECIIDERTDLPNDWGYFVTYRATAPNGSSADGDGACMASEKIVYKKEWIKGKPKKILDENDNPVIDKHKTAENQTLHNVRGHAHTRGFNRAVSNLVGFGEVSAEEINNEDVKTDKPPIKQPEVKKPEPAPSGDVITEPQRKRLFAISKTAKVSDGDMKAFLKSYGFESSNNITKDKYKEICEKVEAGNIGNPVSDMEGCTQDPNSCDDSEWIENYAYCKANKGLTCKYQKENPLNF